ncbi:MAG: hypothetical protein ACRC14_11700 [Paracoccaceae bacterium]
MRRPLLAALSALMLLQACGGGFSARLNPFNWFGRSAPVQTTVVEAPADPRALVADVVAMSVDAYPGGAIVRATGLPPSQGWWSAELVPQPLTEDGVLVYDFRVFPPPVEERQGPAQSREIAVAANLTDRQLAEVRQIVVQGAANARASRR